MGNCVFKGSLHQGVFEKQEDMMVKVVTSNGGIMELFSPITVECITNEFPGHGIFQTRTCPKPLLKTEELRGGEVYYLLPLNSSTTQVVADMATTLAPYRMSTCDKNNTNNKNNNNVWSEQEVFPKYNSSGVWKVKVVISPEKLSEILSQESRTEALIESVRTVAKCGHGVSSSVANSDQWSLSASWKGSISDKIIGLE